jgi:hypothetical protein
VIALVPLIVGIGTVLGKSRAVGVASMVSVVLGAAGLLAIFVPFGGYVPLVIFGGPLSLALIVAGALTIIGGPSTTLGTPRKWQLVDSSLARGAWRLRLEMSDFIRVRLACDPRLSSQSACSASRPACCAEIFADPSGRDYSLY